MKIADALIGVVVFLVLCAILSVMLTISAGLVRRWGTQILGIMRLSFPRTQPLQADFGARFDGHFKALEVGKIAKLIFDRPREAMRFVAPVVFLGGIAVILVWAIAVTAVAQVLTRLWRQ